MAKVKLIWIAPDAEKHIMYCARVSNPKNQGSGNTGLLKYCMRHGHWSIFEMVSMYIEIKTTRAISAQILRHRSFSFQEFSQRYAEATKIQSTDIRRQDTKNRQNSIDDIGLGVKAWWEATQKQLNNKILETYQEALTQNISKECARMLLPMSTETTLYMSGTIRSWIHYLKLRTDAATQKEHRDIANGIKAIFEEQLPNIPLNLGDITK